MCRAFHALLSEMGDWRPIIRRLCFEVLGRDRSKSLEEPSLEEEVFEALNSLCGDKAPSTNSFTMASSNFVGISFSARSWVLLGSFSLKALFKEA